MNDAVTTEETALSVIPASAVSTIIAADENDILGKLAAKVAAFRPDISTAKGRKEIASVAADVASSKMELIRLGKSLTEGWRKSTAAVNAECKIIEERMDALKEQVRRPLTEFENAEKARIVAHEAALTAITALTAGIRDMSSDAILSRLVELEQIEQSGRAWEEFTVRAISEIAATNTSLRHAFDDATDREAEAAELARLRADQAKRDRIAALEAQRQREELIRAEAAETAKREAEARAAREAEEVAAAARRVQEAAERKAAAEVQEAERLARQAREMAAAAQARLAQAEADKIEADAAAQRAKVAAAEKATRDLAAALAAEKMRVADERAAEAAATAKRAENIAHQRKINGEVLADLTAALPVGLSELDARSVITAIAKGLIRHISIQY